MDTPENDSPPMNGTEAPAPSWLKQNAVALAFTAAAAFLIVTQLNVWVVLKVAVGLGLVVFIHELGHFAAAKFCDVHVKTFSIGFGPTLPGCSFRYGETTYKIGLIPLGGFVGMVGQEDGQVEDPDDEGLARDPRSYLNKTVYQRMLIISAGVIMNVILAAACFIVAYLNGVEESPGAIGTVGAGSPAWEAGVQSGTRIGQIGDRENPWFLDVVPEVMSTDKGETINVVTRTESGDTARFDIEPSLKINGLYPMIGIGPEQSLTLADVPTEGYLPYRPNSAAAAAEPPLEPGDRIAAAGPAGGDLTEFAGDGDYPKFHRLLVDHRGGPMTLRVRRGKGAVDVKLPAAHRRHFGLRMRMGRIVAVRAGSPAAAAELIGPKDRETPARVVAGSPEKEEGAAGDKLVAVEVAGEGGKPVRYTNAAGGDTGEAEIRPLDPMRIGDQLAAWARAAGDKTVRLTVLRRLGHEEGRVTLKMTYDDSRRYQRVSVGNPNAPQPIDGLGLAYQVESAVDAVAPGSPAARAGFRPGDVVTEIRAQYRDEGGEFKDRDWAEVEPHQWAYAFTNVQFADSPVMAFKVKRGEEEVEFKDVRAADDESWPATRRGLSFEELREAHRAGGVLEALSMGLHRTGRSIQSVYRNLRAMFVGRVSTWTLSGPVTIARASYTFAGRDVWTFILFIGLISVNLAVVNFLPVPVLDGGHMVFLLYEMVRGKPAPERVQVAAVYIGLGLILALFAWVLFLDVRRLVVS